ncbi:DUF397 domain-containing protein [Kitasatospora sp. NPDC091207]|uniref:DUF397 domain-containing protein n=1 Tax=Kitasatospora sp. NPDC091207 TaxID=3364083 RepID=UPI0038194E1F
MTSPWDRSELIWRKSSYSGAQSECVEVSDGLADAIPVRDSKDPAGPVLLFDRVAWAAFIRAVKSGAIPTG